MKKISMMFLVLATILLVTGCGTTKETKQKLVCTSTQAEEGLNIEQVISVEFKNDKLNHMTIDVNSKITDEDVKANWSMFTESMDNDNKEIEADGFSLKVTKDDQNYEYKVTTDIDLEKANKDTLEKNGFGDLLEDNSTLEDNKKSAEKDGFTCEVQ